MYFHAAINYVFHKNTLKFFLETFRKCHNMQLITPTTLGSRYRAVLVIGRKWPDNEYQKTYVCTLRSFSIVKDESTVIFGIV